MPAQIDIKGHADGYRALAALTRSGHPDHALAELVKLVPSHINNCAYCVAAHEDGARTAGVADDKIAATANWRASDLFDAREQAALALAELLTITTDLAGAEGEDARPVWDAAAAAFPGDELTQLVMTIVAINAWNRAMISQAVSDRG